MFSFTLSQQFKAAGISSDMILPASKNRFDGLFLGQNGKPILDRRLQVRLNDQTIRFFFYQGEDTNDPLIEKDYKEIGSISIRDEKETDYDILHFGEQCKLKCKSIKKDQLPPKIILNYLTNNLTGWNNSKNEIQLLCYPFISEWACKNDDKDDKDWFVFFIQCCFLYFILDLEKRESDLAISPYYDDVRNKMRKSMVYRLLFTKTQYYLYLSNEKKPLSSDEYTFKTKEIVDLLMDPQIIESIPSSYYKDKQKYLWFFNPEIELNNIVEKYTSIDKYYKKHYSSFLKRGQSQELVIEQTDGIKYPQLDESLENTIKNYFFRKHSVITAIKTSGRGCKWLYIIYLIIIAVYSIIATASLFAYDKDCLFVKVFFSKPSLWIWSSVVIAALTTLIYLAIKSKSINVFMPRVLVALSIGWLTAFISEDLIKSQLEITSIFTLFALLGVLSIVIILLLGEAKQHSPFYYYRGKFPVRYYHNLCIKTAKKNSWFKKQLFWIIAYKNCCLSTSTSWKIIPVIVHSYFWTLTFGVLMQLVLYPGLLENSKALPEIVFEDIFDEAENYTIRLINFKDALTDYRQDLDGMFVKAAISGVVQGYQPSIVNKSGKSSSYMSGELNYGKRELEKIKERGFSKIEHINRKYDDIRELVLKERSPQKSAVLLESTNQDTIILQNKKDQTKVALASINYGDSSSFAILDSKLKQLKEGVSSFYPDAPPPTTDSTINNQLKWLDELIEATEEEVQRINIFISDNNEYKTLIEWSDNDIKPYDSKICIEHILTNEAKHKHFFSRKVGEDTYIFPRMLILHALMVLIIAFVGQLIISDKSVTEPL